MKLPVIKYGSPLLRKHSANISEEDNTIELSEKLFDTLKNAGGIGLVAPQIGILKRAFVIDTSPLIEINNTDNVDNIGHFQEIFINPEIIWYSSDKISYKEGCLSIPEIFEDIIRPDKIKVKYFDINFKKIENEFDGLIARIFQHEYDHLQGILFIDKLNSLKRKLLTGKLKKIKKL